MRPYLWITWIMDIKKIIIIAGPNGAGKTTFAREFLRTDESCFQFVNADLIASGLSPFAPETAALQAGRLMLTQIAAHVVHGRRFAAGQANLVRYCSLVNVWDVYDNSGPSAVLISEGNL